MPAHKLSPEEGLALSAQRLWLNVKAGTLDECWEWQGRTGNKGYGQIGFCGRFTGTHRIAWQSANRLLVKGEWVLHRCDNPKCCNPKHLFLGDVIDNNRDMVAKGRHVSGAKWHVSQFSKGQFAEIYAALAVGETHRSIAMRYGVSRGCITSINRGKTKYRERPPTKPHEVMWSAKERRQNGRTQEA